MQALAPLRSNTLRHTVPILKTHIRQSFSSCLNTLRPHDHTGSNPLSTAESARDLQSNQPTVARLLRRSTRFEPGIFDFLYDTMPTTTVNSKKRAMPGSAVSAASAPTSSKKRKVDSGPKFYAVKAGFRPGVYTQYSDCQAQTAGFKGAIFKSFTSRQDAEAFVAGKKVASSTPSKDRFYAVAVGNQPGIYTDWSDVAPTIVGVKGPKYKRFDTRAEAIDYIIEFGNKEAIEALGDEGKLSKKRKTDPDPIQALLDDDAGESVEEEKKDNGIVRIYTDGSSLANGRAGSRAGVGVWFGDGDRRNIAERLVGEPQTNQRAELQAIYRALEVAPVDQPVQIYTDSQYSINCVTQWAMSWQRKGWKTAAGEEVKNQDIIRRVLQRMEERKKTGAATMFQWVKGHAMNRGNEAADALAVKGARMT